MARLLGVNIPDSKQIGISLSYIYGIGPSLSKKILKDAKIEATRKTSELKTEELNTLKDIVVEKYRGYFKPL